MWRLQLAQSPPYTPWLPSSSSSSSWSCGGCRAQCAVALHTTASPPTWLRTADGDSNADDIVATAAAAAAPAQQQLQAHNEDVEYMTAPQQQPTSSSPSSSATMASPLAVDMCLLEYDAHAGAQGGCVALHLDGRHVLLRRGSTHRIAREQACRGHGSAATAVQVRLSRARRRCTECSCDATVVDVDDDDDDEDACGSSPRSALCPVYSTRWRHVSSVALDADNAADDASDGSAAARTLPDRSRAHCIRYYGDDDGGGGGGCGNSGGSGLSPTYVTVLSSSHAYLLQAANAGASLRVLRRVRCVNSVVVRAVCADYWDANTVVIGLSDGTLRVLDWRLHTSSNSHDDDGGATPLYSLPAPQPPWLTPPPRTTTRGRAAHASLRHYANTSYSPFASSSSSLSSPPSFSPAFVPVHTRTTAAPVLSCCAFEYTHRVVCGLGDARGALVLADLRCAHNSEAATVTAPVTAAQLRRRLCAHGRHATSSSSAAAAAAAALLDGVGCVPTGAAVCHVRASSAQRGRVGGVDVHGSAFVTTLTALERGDGAMLVRSSDCNDDDEEEEENADATVTQRCATLSQTSAAASSSLLPSPHGVAARLQRLGVLTGNTLDVPRAAAGTRRGRDVCASTSSRPPPSLQLRCAFAGDDGAYLVALQNAALTASLLHTTRHTAHACTLDVHSSTQPQQQQQQPFVAVASAGNVVALETATGETLCVALAHT